MSSKKKGYSAELLGLHGLDNEFKLAHLPFLVVNDVFGVLAFQGSSGTGKTTLVNRLGELNEKAGGGKHGIYSADKVNYEDFYGCPMPNHDSKAMDIYPFPNSISTKQLLLIDELNRATYENQEKFLSLFASRQIDGMPVQCKYMYVAMNPVMNKKNDKYDGTQPLDKALGERITFLINMPNFGQLTTSDKLKVIMACNNQSSWEPSDSLVQQHKEFLSKAREVYSSAKEEHMQKVGEYICEVEAQLKNQSSGIQLEGRRAQFLLTNVLGIYALDTAFNKTSNLEESALQALIGSFPNSLWYEEVNSEALREAHRQSLHMLQLDDSSRTKSFRNDSLSTRALKEITEAAQAGHTIENISKLITMHWPDQEEDPAGHAIWAFSVVAGLKGRRKSQSVLKENEFKRFEDACVRFRENKTFQYYKGVQEEFIKTAKFPSSYTRPDFVDRATTPNAAEEFDTSIRTYTEAVLFTLSLMEEFPELEANSFDDFGSLFLRTANTVGEFNSVSRIYSGEK
ncbi:MAG: hypothetical protein DRQ35_03135, partial [Gammaproteobacteria bacterium]